MSGLVPSYFLKMERAEQHLAEVEGMITDYAARHPYEIGEWMEHEEGGVFRVLRFTEQPSDTLAVVIGDFIHDVRSALNHIAVACAPREFWKRVEFPIYTADPFKQDPTTGEYLKGSKPARDAWNRKTRGIVPAALREITRMQPYQARYVDNSTLHGLLLVEEFSNADKHRELVTIGHGLRNVVITTTAWNGVTSAQRFLGDFKDGAQIRPEFGDPRASAQVGGDARKSVSTTRSVFFLLR